MAQETEAPAGAEAPEGGHTAADGDRRATAVLAVLGGVSPAVVSARFGVPEVVLDRWVTAFVTAGREGLAVGAPATLQMHRDRHLGLVAHELRSPLAMIRGWTDLLRDDPDEDLISRAIDSISRQVARMTRLADDALDATSVALGHLQLRLESAPLGDMVRDTIAARSIDVPEVDVLDNPLVLVDRDRFGQIIDNLLENVRKHATGHAAIQVRQGQGYGEVVISSIGHPIDQGLAQRMFEPFERGQTSGQGVGLGLYVCRSLMVAHQGLIGLRVDEEGNHFWLRFPTEDGET